MNVRLIETEKKGVRRAVSASSWTQMVQIAAYLFLPFFLLVFFFPFAFLGVIVISNSLFGPIHI